MWFRVLPTMNNSETSSSVSSLGQKTSLYEPGIGVCASSTEDARARGSLDAAALTRTARPGRSRLRPRLWPVDLARVRLPPSRPEILVSRVPLVPVRCGGVRVRALRSEPSCHRGGRAASVRGLSGESRSSYPRRLALLSSSSLWLRSLWSAERPLVRPRDGSPSDSCESPSEDAEPNAATWVCQRRLLDYKGYRPLDLHQERQL